MDINNKLEISFLTISTFALSSVYVMVWHSEDIQCM